MVSTRLDGAVRGSTGQYAKSQSSMLPRSPRARRLGPCATRSNSASSVPAAHATASLSTGTPLVICQERLFLPIHARVRSTRETGFPFCQRCFRHDIPLSHPYRTPIAAVRLRSTCARTVVPVLPCGVILHSATQAGTHPLNFSWIRKNGPFRNVRHRRSRGGGIERAVRSRISWWGDSQHPDPSSNSHIPPLLTRSTPNQSASELRVRAGLTTSPACLDLFASPVARPQTPFHCGPPPPNEIVRLHRLPTASPAGDVERRTWRETRHRRRGRRAPAVLP